MDEDELRGAFVRISEQQPPSLRISAEDILGKGRRIRRRRRQLSVVASGAAVAVVAVAGLLVAAGHGTEQGPAVISPAEPEKPSTTPSAGRTTIPATPPTTGWPPAVSPLPLTPSSLPDVAPAPPRRTSDLLPSAPVTPGAAGIVQPGTHSLSAAMSSRPHGQP